MRRTQKLLQGRTMLKHELRRYKNVFKYFLKENIDWAERTFMGRLFQVSGPATEKALSPNDSQVLRTSRVRVSADRKPLLRPTEDVCATWSARYRDIAFYVVISECIYKNVPHSVLVGSRHNNKHNYPQFVRCHVWRLYKHFKAYSKYKIISSKCRQAKHDATRKFEESIITTCKLGKFFRYTNSRLSTYIMLAIYAFWTVK